MIYLVTILLCLFLAWMYDVLGYSKNKWHWYYLLMVWFILLSGFQYMVGSDIPGYMISYEKDYNHLRFDIGDLGGRHQPGWILLNYCCRQITDDFLLLKIIQAIFVNVAVFSFFKRESKHVFLCISLYAFTTYLIFNFNILRQSFALGFMLYYISCLRRGKYGLSILFLFMAYMFHNTALVGLAFPVFKFLKYNKKTLLLGGVLGAILIVFLIKMDLDAILMNMLESDMLGDNLAEHTEIYTKSDKFAVKQAGIGFGRYVQILLVIFPLFYYIRKERDLFWGGIVFLYLVFQVLNYSLPIMFRFRYFCDPIYYIIFSFTVINLSMGRLYQLRYFIITLSFVLYSIIPIKEYLAPYVGSPYRYIDQYYPYYSIFNSEDVDQKKINYFKWI